MEQVHICVRVTRAGFNMEWIGKERCIRRRRLIIYILTSIALLKLHFRIDLQI